MEFTLFITLFSFLITGLHRSDNSLLSRYRNQQQYVAQEDDYGELVPGELDPELYRQLQEEVPELRGRPPSRLPFLASPAPELGPDRDPAPDRDPDPDLDPAEALLAPANRSAVYPTSTRRAPFATRWPANGTAARRFGWLWGRWTGPYAATCYFCGQYPSHRIPRSPLCHDAFNSDNWKARTMARYFRAKCYKNKYFAGNRIQSVKRNNFYYRYDRGLKREVYGNYVGGCYKRFLDVGSVYTTRGCRKWVPESIRSFADHRLRRLEYMLKNKRSACMSSPHASLTPFARGVSLFVRYHVCVCMKKYCNAAPDARPNTATATDLLFISYLLYHWLVY